MVKQQLFIGVALIAGVAIGYFVSPQSAPAVAVSEEVAAPRSTLPDVGESSSLAALRARIKDLEAQLVEKRRVETAERTEVRERGPRMGAANGRSRREWVENLKKENPQAYTAMTNGIARSNRERLERHQKKLDFLSTIDTSRMSASARSVHGALQELITSRETMDEGINWENMSDDEMHSQMEKRREIEGKIAELSAIERKNLIQEAAKELGFQGENAKGFADTIQEIYDATETPGWWSRRGRGQGGRGQGGRGR